MFHQTSFWDVYNKTADEAVNKDMKVALDVTARSPKDVTALLTNGELEDWAHRLAGVAHEINHPHSDDLLDLRDEVLAALHDRYM